MKQINLMFFRIALYMKAPSGILERIIWGASAIIFLLVSSTTANHFVALWTSLFAGFTFAMFVFKMQPVVDFFKRDQA